MDLVQVIPQLIEGVSQELGVEPKEFKLVVVANRDQIDPKLKSRSRSTMKLEWQFKPADSEPSVEIQPKGDNLLMHPHTRSQAPIACNVNKDSGQYADGSSPASLYQAGSYGSYLSAIRSKMICAMELREKGSSKD